MKGNVRNSKAAISIFEMAAFLALQTQFVIALLIFMIIKIMR